MLPLEDTTQPMREALATQGERRRWILEHWPHVVEYAQITRTLATGLAGADVTPVLEALVTSPHTPLAAAADTGESWLVTLAGQLVAPDATGLDPASEQLLADVAGYRRRWAVTGPAPLGDGAFDPEQAAERAVLTLSINHTAGHVVAEPDTRWQPRPMDHRRPALEDTLGG